MEGGRSAAHAAALPRGEPLPRATAAAGGNRRHPAPPALPVAPGTRLKPPDFFVLFFYFKISRISLATRGRHRNHVIGSIPSHAGQHVTKSSLSCICVFFSLSTFLLCCCRFLLVSPGRMRGAVSLSTPLVASTPTHACQASLCSIAEESETHPVCFQTDTDGVGREKMCVFFFVLFFFLTGNPHSCSADDVITSTAHLRGVSTCSETNCAPKHTHTHTPHPF